MAGRRFKVFVHPDGRVEGLDTPEFRRMVNKLATGSELRRATHIDPVNAALRQVFYLLRGLFGDEGRVAAWTRRWRCRWRVDLRPSKGPLLYENPSTELPFIDRQKAIEYEHTWLFENYFPQARK